MINWKTESDKLSEQRFIAIFWLSFSSWTMDRFKEGRVDHFWVSFLIWSLNWWNLPIIVWFETRASRVLMKLQGLASKRTYASSAGIEFYWIKISFGFKASHSWEFTLREAGVCFLFLSHVKIDYHFAARRSKIFCNLFSRLKDIVRSFFTRRHRIFTCCANIFIAARAFAKLNLNY